MYVEHLSLSKFLVLCATRLSDELTLYYCIKPTLPVLYKHVLTGGNGALTGENVYQSVNSCAVNDRFVCLISSIRAYLVNNVRWTFVLVRIPSPLCNKAVGFSTILNSFSASSLMTCVHHKKDLTQNHYQNKIREQKLIRNISTACTSSHPLLKHGCRFLSSKLPSDVL